MRNAIRYSIQGIVQGVGFRPFIYRIAKKSGLTGTVRNTPAGVIIEAEGSKEAHEQFEKRLETELPPLARIDAIEKQTIEPLSAVNFEIIPSSHQENPRPVFPPDIAICDDCLREMMDPKDRRYMYPLISCTDCGPRYTIITDIPYDRKRTTMAAFPLCEACLAEYKNPESRRFHHQTTACPVCGPRYSLFNAQTNKWRRAEGETSFDTILKEGIAELQAGRILAIKGVGGFHLACAADNDLAVEELRMRKGRGLKPFGIMVQDVEAARRFTRINSAEETALTSYQRPIVLLEKCRNDTLSANIAPDNNYLGIMLPYTGLHYLLFEYGNFPALIMTSGNISEEPIIADDDEAFERLSPFVDLFLTHNRLIYNRCDDSVVRIFRDEPQMLRRSRGYVASEIKIERKLAPTLAVSGEMKNAVCLAEEDRVYFSQHIGDLKNAQTYDFFRHSVTHLEKVLGIEPEIIVHDLHPDYLSTDFALQQGKPTIAVQHHKAHAASVMAERGLLEKEVIAITLDGTGYGEDDTAWGGEIFTGMAGDLQRAAHLLPVALPGGDIAAVEAWRMGMSYLEREFGDDMLLLDLPLIHEYREEIPPLIKMIRAGVNSPMTSSMGRLFDAVSALLNFRLVSTFDADAAITLEMKSHFDEDMEPYPYTFFDDGHIVMDFLPAIAQIVADIEGDIAPEIIGGRFHLTVANMVCDAARVIQEETKIDRAVLSGGCFNNRLLQRLIVERLEKDGMTVYYHSIVPPGDGCIALGQAALATIYNEKRKKE